MDADAVQVFQNARFQETFEEVPGESRSRRRDQGCLRVGFANGFGGRQGERRVLLDVGFGFPEKDVGFVPDFPNDAPSVEMPGGGGRPTRKGCDAFRVLR